MNINKNVYPIEDPKLLDFADSYYVLEFNGLPHGNNPFNVPPLGFPAMLFCYNNCQNFFNLPYTKSSSIIVGQLTRHFIVMPVEGTKVLGMNFKPYGFFNLFGIPPKNIKNSAIETASFFGADNVAHIESILNGKGTIHEAIDFIEKMVLIKQTKVKDNAFLDGIVDHIVEHHGLVNIESLIKDKISVRTLQRYFSEAIGISPKLFCQILRHKFIMDLLYQNPDLKWNEIILEGFYHDYSHFKSDFIKFTGVKPMQFIEIKNPFAQAVIDKQ
jgi:AraC-like DNA-binding protein